MLSLKRLSFVSVFAVLLFVALTGVAQTTFSGKIIDIESKEPLSFASVWVKSTNNAVITQIDGSFSIGPVRSSDTVLISALGYKDLEVYGNRISAAETEIEMIPVAIQIDAITVRPGKNPAIPIVKKAIHNRRDNRPENVKNIELISYNKLNFSLSGIDSTIFDLGFFRKHADVLVKTNDYDNTYNVPMYFSEYMNYEKRQENKLPEIQEIVKTQHGVSFAENEVVTKYMASLNEKMSFYNNIRFLSKDFISPISTQAMLYYRYYLDDSIVDNSRTYYRIRFRPKNSQDLAFYGYMIIEKDSGALAEIDATLQPTSILNFVRKLRLFEKYQLTADGQWFNRQQKMTAEFVPELSKDTAYKAINTPLTAIKSTTFIIDSSQINDYLQNRVVPGRFNLRRSDYGQRDTSFLSQYRPDTLTSLDLITQQAIEKTNQIPAVKAGNKVMNMLLYGYLTLWKIDFGPYLYFIQSNKIEGTRLNLCARTSKQFHDKMMLGGYVGYGCRNQKFKFGAQYSLRVPTTNFGAIHIRYDQNIYRIGDFRQPLDLIRENVLVQSDDNLFSALLTQSENDAVYLVKRGVAAYEQQINKNITIKPGFIRASHYNPPYYQFDTITQLPKFRTYDFTFDVRISFKEEVSIDHFRHTYITTRYPIIHCNFMRGKYTMPNMHDWYNQFRLVVNHNVLLGVGKIDYVVEAGYISSPVPFPLLEIHRGNETGGSGQYYFNHMNYMEFASDAFVNLYVEYGLNGFFFNKIWGLRKLKLRELLTFKACYGRMLNDNGSVLSLPVNTYELKYPYMEAGIGVTNLLKFIRLEYIWRLNYLDHPDLNSTKGLFIRFNFEF